MKNKKMKKIVIVIIIILIAIISILSVIFLNSTYIEIGIKFFDPADFLGTERGMINSYIITYSKDIKKNNNGNKTTLGRLKKENLEELKQRVEREVEGKDSIKIDLYSMGSYVKIKGKTYVVSEDFRIELQNFINEKKIN